MIDTRYALRMAAYNRWMNQSLYACAARLDDAQRREDRGAYFKSLHGTLEHLVFADALWIRRFKGESLDGLAPGQWLQAGFEAMRERREALDQEIAGWAATLSPDWLQADFHYYSVAYGRHYVRPAWLLVTHLFNHQAHHRGQATTLLMQSGIDPGATDLPAMDDL